MPGSLRASAVLTSLAVLALAPAAHAQPAPAPAPADAPGLAEGTGDYATEIATLLGASGGLTSDQAAARAAKVSPTVRRKLQETLSAETRVRTVKLARVPRVDTTLRYTRLSAVTLPSVLAGFITIPLNNYAADATLAVPISDYFVRIPPLVDAANAEVRGSKIAEESARLTAAVDARVAYYEWVRARLQVVVAEHLVVQVGQTVKQVEALVEVQRASKADLLRLQAQAAQAELARVQTRSALAIREEQLRILIGAAPEEPLTIGEDVRTDVAVPTLGSDAQLVRDALARRLETRSLTAAEDALKQLRQSQKAERYPRLSAFAQANYDDPNQRAIGSTGAQFSWALGAQITWSPNDLLGAGPKIDDTTAKLGAIEADRQNLQDGVRAELTADVQQVEIAREAIVNTGKALAAAEEGYRVRKELLAAERVTAVELVDAETELTRARIDAIDARVDLRIALTRLTHAEGRDVK
jgi:outer membrane protein TolC